MVVGIDASNLSPSGMNPGTRTHLVEMLCAAEPEAQGVKQIVVWSNPSFLDTLPARPWLEKRTESALSGNLLRRALWQRRNLSDDAERAGCDILLIPGGQFLGSFRPFVAMSQNLLPFERSEFLRYRFSSWLLKTLILRQLQVKTFRRANGIIFLSEYAQKVVKRATGKIAGEIATIPHGVNQRFASRPKRQARIQERDEQKPFRILYVSTVDHYKHQWHVASAVGLVRKKSGWPISIDFVGPAYSHALPRLRQELDRCDPQGQWACYRGALPYTELHHAYGEADMAVFASSCENMPNILLEKMIAGLPLACSNRGPMPEVLRDAGEYFDPENPDEIAGALEKLIASDEHRQDLAEKAYSYAQAYSWGVCAAETLTFLRHVAGRQPTCR